MEAAAHQMRGGPAGGRRLVQGVEGYRATLVAGQVTMEDGKPTGSRPGGLVRSAA